MSTPSHLTCLKRTERGARLASPGCARSSPQHSLFRRHRSMFLDSQIAARSQKGDVRRNRVVANGWDPETSSQNMIMSYPKHLDSLFTATCSVSRQEVQLALSQFSSIVRRGLSDALEAFSSTRTAADRSSGDGIFQRQYD